MPGARHSLATHQALNALYLGGVIACPTEAVWGLSCDPWDEEAVRHLLELKGREESKGLILVASSAEQFNWLIGDLPSAQHKKLHLSWPGAATWLVPHYHRVPEWISGAHATVAIRVTSHPPLARLCAAWGGPLVSTSANPSGCRAPVHAFQVRRYFGDCLDHIMPGAVGGERRPSVIRDVETDRVIRA